MRMRGGQIVCGRDYHLRLSVLVDLPLRAGPKCQAHYEPQLESYCINELPPPLVLKGWRQGTPVPLSRIGLQ